jgi:hypothetical protein
MLRPFLLSALVLLAGCARSEEARYAQVNNAPLPALNSTDQGEEDELTIGTWQTALQGDQPALEFGPVGATARFSLSCDARRNLLLQWPGAAPGGDLPIMLVTVGSETRRLAVTSSGGSGSPMLRGALAANDPFLRALTGAATRIVVRIGNAPPLVMPPSPTIAAYAQQCTSGEARATPVPALGNGTEPSGSINVVAGNAATTNAQ